MNKEEKRQTKSQTLKYRELMVPRGEGMVKKLEWIKEYNHHDEH